MKSARRLLSLSAALALALLASDPVALGNEPLSVGGVTARRGEKVSGWLDVPAGVDAGTTATLRGKPAITTESGGMGLTDEPSVAAQERGAMNVAAYLKIFGAAAAPPGKPVFIDRSEVVRTPVTGVWFPAVGKMENVAAGALLGRVTDPFGKVLHEAKAPFAGEVLYVVATPPVTEGEPLAFIGRIVPEP